jgi:hypothetical protein
MVVIDGLELSSQKNGVVSFSQDVNNIRIHDYRNFGGRQQILTITNENISQISSATEPVDQDLMTVAETIFASPGIWNASFLVPNNKHVPSTWRNMGVDLHEVFRY